MRNAKLAILAVLAGGTAAIAGSTPAAAAYDYPWCVSGGELGYAGDCSYQTLAQCQASAYGRWNLYCIVNPRVAFARHRGLQEQGAQPRQRPRRDY